jgi:tetratricopeptide (TPR) repeat protein
MPKKLLFAMEVILLSVFLVACSSPEDKAASYIDNAALLFEEGKLGKAEIEYKNALQINQNLPDAWYGLARIYDRKQEWRKAYAVLTKIMELAPNHVDGRIMLGQIRLASNQIDHALSDAKDILVMAPGDARSHALMAAVQFRLENLKGAAEEVKKALAIEPDNSEATLVFARVLIARKKYDGALQLLDKAIRHNPDNLPMYLMKIQAYRESGNEEAVESVYLALIESFPENLTYKNALASHYIEAGDTERAERILEQITNADTANADNKLRLVAFKNQYRSAKDAIALLKTYINSSKDEYRYRFALAELYEKNDQPDRAISIYEEIYAADEEHANGLEALNKIALIEMRAGNRDKARALVDKVLARDKANEDSLLMLAGFQIAEQEYGDAVVTIRTVLRDRPDSIRALGMLGQAYDLMGSGELAVESYTKAFQLNPGGASVIANNLAKSLIRKGKVSLADDVLQESISHGNRTVDAIRLMAQIKLSLGDWDNAERLAKQLQSIEGQEAVSQQVLGIAYQGKKDQEASIEAFKRAHELSPASRQPIVALVRTYVRNGKITEARQFLESVLSVHDDNTTAYLMLGQLSLHEKDISGAISNFNKVIEINPRIDAGYLNLVSLYLRRNDVDRAEAIVMRGLSELPEHPMLTMNLASVYERKGDFGKAIETYETLLDKNPNLVVAKNNLASLLTDYGGNQASLDRARNIAAEFRSSRIPQFRDTYAWASVKSGVNLEEAVMILEGIVKENEQVDVYNYHLGEAYRARGDSNNAVAYLTRAVNLARPNSDIADQAKQSLRQLNQ